MSSFSFPGLRSPVGVDPNHSVFTDMLGGTFDPTKLKYFLIDQPFTVRPGMPFTDLHEASYPGYSRAAVETFFQGVLPTGLADTWFKVGCADRLFQCGAVMAVTPIYGGGIVYENGSPPAVLAVFRFVKTCYFVADGDTINIGSPQLLFSMNVIPFNVSNDHA